MLRSFKWHNGSLRCQQGNASGQSADSETDGPDSAFDVADHRVFETVEPCTVLPRDLWSASLQETIVEVFATMVGAAVTTAPTDAPLATAQLTGVIGIAGAIRANFLPQCSHAVSAKLSSQMLGIPPDDPDSRKASAEVLGEICNIVAGYFKAKVGLGDTCMLSVPTIIVGQNYKFHPARMFQKLELAVSYEGEQLLATLEIAR